MQVLFLLLSQTVGHWYEITEHNGAHTAVQLIVVGRERLLFCQGDGLYREATVLEFMHTLKAMPLLPPQGDA